MSKAIFTLRRSWYSLRYLAISPFVVLNSFSNLLIVSCWKTKKKYKRKSLLLLLYYSCKGIVLIKIKMHTLDKTFPETTAFSLFKPFFACLKESSFIKHEMKAKNYFKKLIEEFFFVFVNYYSLVIIIKCLQGTKQICFFENFVSHSLTNSIQVTYKKSTSL